MATVSAPQDLQRAQAAQQASAPQAASAPRARTTDTEQPTRRREEPEAARPQAAEGLSLPMAMFLTSSTPGSFGFANFLGFRRDQGNDDITAAPAAGTPSGGTSFRSAFSDAAGSLYDRAASVGNWFQNTFNSASTTVSGLLHDIADNTVGRFRYLLGGTGGNGGIDCSNYTRMCVDKLTDSLRAQGRLDRTTEAKIDHLFQTTSEGQLVNMMRYGNRISENQLLHGGLQAGQVLFMDTGRTRFDAGRQYGTDHVAYTFKDENGHLMVAESRGGRGGGTVVSDADSYVQRMAQRGNITAVSLDQVMVNVAREQGLRLELT